MNKYRDRPDYELNLAVARHLGHNPSLERGVVKIEEEFAHGKIIISSDFDPCNNPADAMPIVIDNKITVAYDHRNCVWVAYFASEISAYSDNYYRAAMEVFLMMKDDE
ncbi:hypothetical protein [Proteus phage vB_PmiP_RS51pmB]|nr:hypothetical protein [Proteus phage vB_PmiP_RS51pmB]